MKELAPGLCQLSGFPPYGINVYLMGDVLVDAATRHAGRRILRQLKGRQVSGARADARAPGPPGREPRGLHRARHPVLGRRRDADAAEDPQLIGERQPKTRLNSVIGRFWTGPGHPVDRRLHEGDEVAGFTVLDVPGHSAGHVAYWRESDRVARARRRAEQHERRHREARPVRAEAVLHAGSGPEPRVDPQGRRARAGAGRFRARAAAPRPAALQDFAGQAACLTSRPMPADRLKQLEERTRYDPAEVEGRVFERWEEAGIFSPEPEGDGVRELLDRGPAAERDRRAAHGPRPERLDPGHADPAAPHAGRAHEVDLRHRPRGHRDAGQGREAARAGGHLARRDRPRGVHRARLGVARGVRRHDHRAVQAARRLARLRGRALHDGRGVRARGPARLRGALREGPGLPRQLHGQLGPGHCARRSRTSRSSSARSRTRSTWSTTRSSPARGRSRSRRCGRRRCSPTPRSP